MACVGGGWIARAFTLVGMDALIIDTPCFTFQRSICQMPCS